MQSTLSQFCHAQGIQRTYWIAYSGGRDSHVLLHAMSQLRETLPIKLHAIHIHHGLSQQADHWVAHCQTICQDLQIELTVDRVNAQSATGESPEEIAREKRYHVFSSLLKQDDILLTAHHQEDQAETLLIQLFRGAGPKGLAAMPKIKTLGQGMHARPLLAMTENDFQQYAEQHQLRWIEDESNFNVAFSRNYIRHHIMPVLKARWPSVASTLSRVSHHCAEAQQLLETQAREDCLAVQGSTASLLSVSKLVALDDVRQRQVLRTWLATFGAVPSAVKLQQIQRDILQSRYDKMPYLRWKGKELRRFRDDLYVIKTERLHHDQQHYDWDLTNPLWIPGLGRSLMATPSAGSGIVTTIKTLTVRFRQGGETCRLANRTCHHRLKNLFQAWNIPYWERDRIPLLYHGDQLISVVGYYIDERYQARPDELGNIITLAPLP